MPPRSTPPTEAPTANAATWARLKDLVADALELPPAKRQPFLAVECAHNPDQLRHAEGMLAAATAAADFLEWPALQPATVAPLPAGTRCGPYTIEALVGEGGFSEVYRALQELPIARRVALKVLKPGMDSRAVLARFAIERRTLALLEHPGIARILDAGATATGRPYVAMEFVDGRTLAQFVASENPTRSVRIALFLQICEAVAHAHQRGIIHRDLKPSNLLVTQAGGTLRTKVIDFGIAKVLEGDGDERTRTGQLLGTPAYCSPEQKTGNVGEIDVRTDVFALGIVFCELLTGARPAEPGPAGNAAKRRDPPREVDWIVAKACAPERERRYDSVVELAADVRAFLAGDALRAGPLTRRYRLGKFARRHRVALVATTFIAVAWLGGGIAASIGFYRADRARQEAEVARREADATAEYLARLIGEVEPKRAGRDVKVVELLNASDALLRRAADEPDVAARLHHVIGKAYQALGEFAQAEGHLRAAADSYAARHGELDWRGIEAACDLASLLHRAGNLAAATPLVEQVSTRAIAARGPNHGRARILIDMRAKLAFDSGRPADAEGPLRELLAIDEGTNRTTAIITTLGNLAQVLLGKRETAEARRLAERARDLAQQHYGPRHPLTMGAVRKLAAVSVQEGDHAAVVALLGPVLPIAERVLGKDHPDTLGIANYLVFALQQQGKLDEAEPLYRELLAAQKSKLARLHPQAVMTLLNFGRLLQAKKNFVAAEPVLRDAHARFAELRGAEDENTLAAAYYLAKSIAAQGRHTEVAAAFALAVAALQKRYAADSKLVVTATTEWAQHLCELADIQQRDGNRTAALATWELAFGVATERKLTAVRMRAATALADLCAAGGDHEAAARWRDSSR